MQCRVNGICTAKDVRNYRDWQYRSGATAFLTMALAYAFIFDNQSNKFISPFIFPFAGNKYINVFPFITFFVSGIFVYYKYSQMNSEFDVKYTPLYLTSKGKL